MVQNVSIVDNVLPDAVFGDRENLVCDITIEMPKMEFVEGHPNEYFIFLKKLTEKELAQISSLV